MNKTDTKYCNSRGYRVTRFQTAFSLDNGCYVRIKNKRQNGDGETVYDIRNFIDGIIEDSVPANRLTELSF